MTNEQETIKEQVSLLRKYAYEFGLHNDLETHALMMSAQKSIFDIIDAKDKEFAEVRAKLEAAEACIKASQEQEPVGYMTDSGMYKIDGSFWQAVGDVVFKWRKLYAQPPIPPELAELQREIALLRTGDTCARHCEGEAFRHEAQRLKRENAELRKQLESSSSAVPEGLTDEIKQMRKGLINSRLHIWIGTDQQSIIDRDYPKIAALSAAPKVE